MVCHLTSDLDLDKGGCVFEIEFSVTVTSLCSKLLCTEVIEV